MSQRDKRSNIVLIVFFGGLALLVILVFLANKQYSWIENYKEDNDQPYGTELFSRLLQESKSEGEYILHNDSTLSLPEEPFLYILTGNYAYLDSSERAFLDSIAYAGNEVLLSVNIINADLFNDDEIDREKLENEASNEELQEAIEEMILEDEVYSDEDIYPEEELIDDDISEYEEYEQDSIPIFEDVYWPWMGRTFSDTTIELSVQSSGTSRKLDYIINNERTKRDWPYFGTSSSLPFGDNVVIRGSMNDSLVNFISFPRGEGQISIHLCPLAFTNYALLDQAGFEYANAVLSEFDYESVIWDKFNKTGSMMNKDDFERSYTPPQSPLSFILSERGLRWGWYLLLFTALLFLVLGARRKQRPIPVVHQLRNTSLEFTDNISRLFLRKKNHRIMAQLQWRLFLSHIRSHYGMPTSYSDDNSRAQLIKGISLRSGIEHDIVNELFETHKRITIIFEVDNNLFLRFHDQLEDFYKQAK